MCTSPQSNLKWIPTTSATFALDMVDRKPIRGGLEKYTTDKTMNIHLHIGRGLYKNQLITGKILTVNSTESVLQIAYNETASQIDQFDVLVFDV